MTFRTVRLALRTTVLLSVVVSGGWNAWPQHAAAAGCTGAAPADVVYLPNVTKTLGGPDGWVTPFIVQNIGTTSADLEVSFYRFDDGSLVTCRRVTGLLSHASWADIPNNDADLPDNTQFSVLVRSYGASIAAVVNEVQGSADAPVAMAYTGLSVGATSVSLPNITRRFYGYDTPFIVQNLGNATATVAASFISFDGTKRFALQLSILPARAKPVDPDYTPGLIDGTQYAVTLTSNQPIAAIVNEYNAYHPFGRPLADSYNGFVAADGAPDLYVPYVAKTVYLGHVCCDPAYNFLDSPVVVQNMDIKPVTPSIAFSGQEQQWTGDQGTNAFIDNLTFIGPTLAPGASWAFDPEFTVGTTTPCDAAPPFPTPPTCLPNGTYTAHIHADGLIAARPTIRRFSSSLVHSESFRATALAPKIFLPNVVKTLDWSGGWTSFIQVVTANQTMASNQPRLTAYWYRFSDGQLMATQRTDVCVKDSRMGC